MLLQYRGSAAKRNFLLIVLVVCLNFIYIKATCTIGSIRLVGGSTDSEGRVEICRYNYYLSGNIYGTICDDLWDTRDAMVVCRQLGYTSGTAYNNSHFGQGSGVIVMSNVQCTGSESYLTSCPHTINHNCDHSKDAGVSCEGDSQGSGVSVGAIVGGVIGGIVLLICVCAVIVVACAVVLRFKSSRAKQKASVEYPQQQEPQGYGGTNPANCGSSTFDSIRLVGGSEYWEGRVEVCINGSWGTVCDDSWDVRDATVACIQSGYNVYRGIPYKNSYFGAGNGSIFMANVRCTGDEFTLTDCPHTTNHNCDHSNEAGVRCESRDSDVPEGYIVGGIVGGIVFLILLFVAGIAVCVAVPCFTRVPKSSRAIRTVPVDMPAQATSTESQTITKNQSYVEQNIV
uniref:SRCR domain-containing protein n=1 Tax=Amphimedon queenslandica TaxID=400682 RepID=A0A1X7V9G5_AMPQE